MKGAKRNIATQPVRLMDRAYARLLARRARVTALVSAPEPRIVGLFARGQQMIAGNFLMAGEFLHAQGTVPFKAQTTEALDELHGFTWLDHLAVVGDGRARRLAQTGLSDWLDAYGAGDGPGWAPGLAGRRAMRWISHALFVMQGMDEGAQTRFLRALDHHGRFLDRRAGAGPAGLPRIEAYTGQLFTALALEGRMAHLPAAQSALLAACKSQIGKDGGIITRNPEDLLGVFSLLSWAAQALQDRDQPISNDWRALMERIGHALRVLRHADDGLVRFHGGGRGQDGALSAGLATLAQLASARPSPAADHAMGIVRLGAGRCTVLIDAAPPPLQSAPTRAHASTLAFELTSNRRPLIVSCGDGRAFGPDWHRASRATASHSALSLDGYSSSRFSASGLAQVELTDGPRNVAVEFRHTPYARAVALGHDGYIPSHGLEHLRYLDLSGDGRVLSGEDMLVATTKSERKRFDEVYARTKGAGIGFTLRFHLHPECEASLDMKGTAISIALRSGEIWVFRADIGKLALSPSVYLEKGRVNPRASQQIVLSLQAQSYTTQINWSLAKAHDTPTALRDTQCENPLALPEL